MVVLIVGGTYYFTCLHNKTRQVLAEHALPIGPIEEEPPSMQVRP